jgi:hypothetical protein
VPTRPSVDVQRLQVQGPEHRKSALEPVEAVLMSTHPGW